MFYPGVVGEKGDEGTKGDRGYRGPPGVGGNTGNIGPKGEIGNYMTSYYSLYLNSVWLWDVMFQLFQNNFYYIKSICKYHLSYIIFENIYH